MALVLSPRLCVTSIDAQPFVKSVCEGFPLATEVCAQEGMKGLFPLKQSGRYPCAPWTCRHAGTLLQLVSSLSTAAPPPKEPRYDMRVLCGRY